MHSFFCNLFIISAVLFYSLSAKSAANKTITLGTTNATVTPLYQKAHRILTYAFLQFGYDLSIKVLPNKRSLIWANHGVLDGDLFRISNLDLTTFMNLQRVDEPLFVIDQSVIGKAGIKVNGWQSMNKYIVAYERGTKFIETHQDKFKGVILVNTFDQAVALIHAGRADITITSRNTANTFLARLKYDHEVMVHQPPLVEIALHVYINKYKHPELADKLSALLRLMKSNGQFEALLSE
ncbi:hypothetical protein CXF85_01465 [Colwellia sp. 75C3]|uniref:transporter substrate-binding domain-containing protein n=1 Tax=Colwellia sp. 75C3 TaxID=888425 RepID=UPI000C339480|nr:transporter substrate-binding domain-containing protein [Colwellia sp. 75C3]PKG86398.1 hypothetical protein CXF85_01465 [Colwellia sp. 75C3]